jgi:hypothetical protein
MKERPALYNDIAPWMRFKKASNDAAVKNIMKTKKKIELPQHFTMTSHLGCGSRRHPDAGVKNITKNKKN